MVENHYYVGVDVGSTVCKAVAVNDGKEIKALSLTPVKGDPESAANRCLKDIAKKLKVKFKSIKKKAVATGQNSEKISIKEKASEITCLGTGAYTLNPEVRIVLDVGSFSMKALRMDESGKIKDFLMNNKCASGSGILLELVAEGLEMKVDELSDMGFQGKSPISISSQCSIFAESEVISYKNEGANIADLVAGVCNSIAGRVYPMIRRLNKDPKSVVFSGSVALNEKIAYNLEERLKIKLIKLPIEPTYLTAYGAAIISKNGGTN